MELLLNEFDLDIFESAAVYDPLAYYEQYEQKWNNEEGFILTEATKTKVTKGNILKKLWELFKKALRWIGKKLQAIIDFIKRLFKKNKTMKTADQCAEEIIGKPKKRRTTSNQTNNSAKSAHNNTISIELPSNEMSTVKTPKKIDVPVKDILIKFDAENNGNVVLNISYIQDIIMNRGPRASDIVKENIPAQGKAGGANLKFAIELIADKELLGLFEKVVEDIEALFSLGSGSDLKDYKEGLRKKLVEYLSNDIGRMNKRSDEVHRANLAINTSKISLNALTEFQQKLNTYMGKINEFDLSNSYLLDGDNYVVRQVNWLLAIMSKIQMGLNVIHWSIAQEAIIDASYAKSVNDIGTLAEFAKALIDAGVPGKYVSYNCYIVAGDDIQSTSNNNKDYPCWGQSRVTFFPKDKTKIYKIALSGMGLMANKIEYDISKKVVASKKFQNWMELPIARTYESKGDYTAIIAERVSEPADNHIPKAEFLKRLSIMETINGIPEISDYVWDPNDWHNIGQRPGSDSIVLLDYGWTERKHRPRKS